MVHGVEEYFTGFYNADWSFRLMFGSFNNLQLAFIYYQLALWLILLLTYIAVSKGKYMKSLLVLLGVVSILELQHLFVAIKIQHYYPGLITALLFPIAGYFYWKELIFKFKRL